MKIGIDVRMGDGEYGIGQYSLQLVKNILDLDCSNEYFLFVRNPGKILEVCGGPRGNATVVKADYRHYSYREQIGLAGLLRKYNLDLVHFTNFNVPLLYNRPFVVTIHDVIHHKFPSNKQCGTFHSLAYKSVIISAARRSRRIITVSEFSRRQIVEALKVPPEKVSVIYEAQSPVPVTESEVVAVKQKFGIAKPYILFVGVMERKKNLVNLAKGFDIVKSKYSLDIQLVFAGKHDRHYPELDQQLRSIVHSKALIFTGVVTDQEKYALYKGAEAFVSSSLYEGFGLPGVEAMSLSTPLIVSNTEVFREVYDNGAIYFDPLEPETIAQRINLLLRDPEYKRTISDNALSRAHCFSWQKTAAETMRVYSTALDRTCGSVCEIEHTTALTAPPD